MDLWTLCDQLEECGGETTAAGKDQILEDILDSVNSQVFRDVAEFVYNPYRKAHIKVTNDLLLFASDVSGDVEPYSNDVQIWSQFKSLLQDLESRTISGNAAKQRTLQFFVRLPAEYHDFFIGVLNKDLKIGVGPKIIRKHLPGFIPQFSVQLCPSKQWDGSHIPHGGWLVSPKIDGIRGIIGPFGNNPDDKYRGYKALSRNGHVLSNVDHILDVLSHVAQKFYDKNSLWPVFDGEFYTHGWELSSSIVSSKVSGHPEAEKLQYHVFDFLTHVDWNKSQCKATAAFREKALASILDDTPDSIVKVPSLWSLDAGEVQAITQAYVDDGYEGSVLKGYLSEYEFKRSKAWQKYKPFHDLDATVAKIVIGKLDSRGNLYDSADPRATGQQVARSLVISVVGTETHVGTGLSRQQRIGFAKDPDSIIGRTITVRYQRISEDGKLIFPRFQGIRKDK